MARACTAAQNAVHLFGRKRDSRRVDPHIASPCFCINARAQPGLVSWCRSAKHGRTALYRPSLSRKKAAHVGFFPRFRARWLHGYGFGFCFFGATGLLSAHGKSSPYGSGLGRFFQGYQDGWNPRRSSRQRLFHDNRGITHIADFTNRSPIARRCATSTSGRSPLPNTACRLSNPPARNGARYRTSNIMRGTAQTSLNTTEDHRYIFHASLQRWV